MSNRFEREFPPTSWRPVAAPISQDEIQVYLERGRRLRAEAMNRALRWAAAGLVASVHRLAAWVRRAAHGALKQPPRGGHRPVHALRLTGDCR